MKSRILIAVLVLAGWSCHAPDSAHAAVVVLANKTDRDVHFADISVSGQSRDYTLSAGEVLPLPVRGAIAVILSTDSGSRRFELKSNTVYCFLGSPKRLELKQIGLASNWGQATRPIVNPESAKTAKPTAKPAHPRQDSRQDSGRSGRTHRAKGVGKTASPADRRCIGHPGAILSGSTGSDRGGHMGVRPSAHDADRVV